MLKEILNIYESGKCVTLLVVDQGFFSQTEYEARIYITKPRIVFLEEQTEEAAFNLLAKKIIANQSQWKELSNKSKYTHSLKLKEYPDFNIQLKKK